MTTRLNELKYDAFKMFKTADEFYQSMGMESNEMSYTGDAVIEKPKDRKMECHPTAWDLSNGKDFYTIMCTSVTAEDFYTIHHEMGKFYAEFYLNCAPIRF